MKSSLLELRVGGVPVPRGGAHGEWRYRHAVRPEGPSEFDQQVVHDFFAYEAAHDRRVHVIADPSLSDWETWRAPVVRPHPGAFATQCCSHVYRDGCAATLVCHGTPPSAASQILADGALRPATGVTGRAATRLAATGTWGQPADYFEHVTFANGRCTAPEAVACSRTLSRDVVPADLRPGYPPAVRFYFAWKTLATRPDARFDGVHPVKIHGELLLDDALVAVVVHASQRRSITVTERRFEDRIAILDAKQPRPEDWATAAFTAAEQLL